MSRQLPAIAKRNVRSLTKFVRAVKPGATNIEFIDALGASWLRWKCVQFHWRGKMGVATLGVRWPQEVAIEHPYGPLLGHYNDTKEGR